MEIWATVLVALIVALSTLGATFIQSRYSSKRFERELKRAREADERRIRWEVRSEALLKLRHELAQMATKLKMLVIYTQEQHYRSNITEDEKNKELEQLEQAVEDLKVYGTSGDFLQTLNLQYDAELLRLVEEIKSNYLLLFEYALDYKRPSLGQLFELGHLPEQLEEFSKLSQETETKIPEVQELINKRLEEL